MMDETEIAISAAHEAGRTLETYFGDVESQHVSLKNGVELVTEADFAANDVIIRRLNRAFPGYRILSEETEEGRDEPIDDRPTWIIDPLDGTSNFASRIPIFAVAIALVKNRETVLSVIHVPTHDDTYVAEKGRGATLNWDPIKVTINKNRPGAMLLAGRGHTDRDRERHRDLLRALERKMPYFRRLGSAAVMMALVAAGRGDGVILTGNKPWDIVPGELLIREAGGVTTDYNGAPWGFDSTDIVASNGQVQNQIIELTSRLDKADLPL